MIDAHSHPVPRRRRMLTPPTRLPDHAPMNMDGTDKHATPALVRVQAEEPAPDWRAGMLGPKGRKGTIRSASVDSSPKILSGPQNPPSSRPAVQA